MALGLLRKLACLGDDRDGVEEGAFDQDWGLAHWDAHRGAWDGWGWTQVYSMAFWEYVNVILTISTSADVPNLHSTSFQLVYTDVLGWMFIPAERANTSAESIASWHIWLGVTTLTRYCWLVDWRCRDLIHWMRAGSA